MSQTNAEKHGSSPKRRRSDGSIRDDQIWPMDDFKDGLLPKGDGQASKARRQMDMLRRRIAAIEVHKAGQEGGLRKCSSSVEAEGPQLSHKTERRILEEDSAHSRDGDIIELDTGRDFGYGLSYNTCTLPELLGVAQLYAKIANLLLVRTKLRHDHSMYG
ncbi:LOW QUALITY PROTEIN: uncharacterized protein Z518_07791 [Rhinocladiella mackenziei CBS 650.93]|uniref:Uncharacterized protein n=1 Tax=Rhinocladiella mackenziei CBS 650.93 TaxID=1442369 RepID=A0A0D2FPV8_9EURO|nr:LOW QUALITY PROTEIN: uncharacterized protein Z518_07791 [Rhinocladiella mackenziei CBS 650.93]KIX04237.1 LOW QUALITY PROTEIN: hypothetical protein Z518_07791 [Rhinocladiella mackenziei CBS 650.93]